MDDWLLYTDRLRKLRSDPRFTERQYRCAACLDFDIRRISCSKETRPLYNGQPAKYRRSVEVPLEAILKAAESGCQGCTTLRFVAEPHIKTLLGPAVIFIQDARPYVYTLAIKEKDSIQVHGFQDFNIIWPNIDTMTYSGPYALPRTTPISTDTGSEQAVERARSWLDKCMSEHISCSTRKDAKLPTRVLEIEKIGKVRVHVTSNDSAPYICLSHCWGPRTSHVPRLLEGNMEEYQNCVPWSSLTKSFQEAVEFTFRLGIKYIWIDSLCIIQDSVEDWRAEGSKMADIYESAYCTLAAAHASSSTEGCFSKPRDVHQSRYLNIQPTNPREEPYQVHARASLTHGELGTAILPLFSRGWIFQERQLSRRMIYFTKEELIWECQTGNWCECQPESHDFFFGASHRPYLSKPNRPINELKCLDLWFHIVNDYTQLSLTFANDIFPALQGLTKRYGPLLGEFTAGLWERTLLYSLTWFMCIADQLQERPQEWRAPTWSWASVKGTIAFLSLQGQPPQTFASVVKVVTVPKAADVTGQLDSAKLTLKGKCIVAKFRFEYGEIEPHIDIASRGDLPDLIIEQGLSFASERGESKEDLNEYKIIEQYGGGGMFLDYRIDLPGEHHVPDGSEVLLMKINESSPGHHDGEERRVQGWLVLHRSSSREDQYRRIAVLKLTRDGDYKQHMDKLYDLQAEERIVVVI